MVVLDLDHTIIGEVGDLQYRSPYFFSFCVLKAALARPMVKSAPWPLWGPSGAQFRPFLTDFGSKIRPFSYDFCVCFVAFF